MDLWDLLLVLVKRWYVTIPLAALTAVAGIQSGGEPEVTYTAQASYLLLLPSSVTDADGVVSASNPYLSLAAPSALGGILITRLGAADVADQLQDPGGVPTSYSIGQERNSPTLNVSVSSEDAAVSNRILLDVLSRLDATSKELQAQAGIIGAARVTGKVLNPPTTEETTSSDSRLRAAVIAGGILLTALGAVVVEGIATRRRRRPKAPAQKNLPVRVDPPFPPVTHASVGALNGRAHEPVAGRLHSADELDEGRTPSPAQT